MAAAQPPPRQQYIALPGAGIQGQQVQAFLRRAALADFRHDFSEVKFADALRGAIAEIPEGLQGRAAKIQRAKALLGIQQGNVYAKF